MASALSGQRDQRLARFDEFVNEYEKAIEAYRLDRENIMPALKELEQGYLTTFNPLIKNFMPAAVDAYMRHKRADDQVKDFLDSLR